MSEYIIEDVQDEEFFTAVEFIRSDIKSLYPTFDSGPGTAFYDLIVTPLAKLHALNLKKNNEFYAGFDLSKVAELKDSTVVDAILGRYFLSRKTGKKAKGTLYIITTNTNTRVVQEGSSFLYGDLEYLSTAPVRAFATEAQITLDTDVVYKRYGSNSYYFTVPVEAAEIGDNYNIAQRTLFTIPSNFRNVSSIFAAADFQGGDLDETDAAAILRIPEAYSVSTFSSIQGIKSLLQSNFPGIDVSVVGKGDTALLRASRNALGLSVGGFCDVYIRSQVRPSFEELEVVATVVDPNNNILNINLEDYPGIYYIDSISPIGSAGALEITSIAHSTLTTDSATINDVQDGINSYYDVSSVTFIDDVQNTAGLAVGTERNYNVTLFRMPLLGDITTYASDPDVANPGLDLLIRACTPAVVSINFVIKAYAGDPTPDLAAIKTNIVEAIYEYGINKIELDSTIITTAAVKLLGQRSYIDTATFGMSCEVFDHTGVKSLISSANKIYMAPRPEAGVTASTVGFLTSETLINIEVETFS